MRSYLSKWMFRFSDLKKSIGCFKNLNLNGSSNNQFWPMKVLKPSNSTGLLVMALAVLIPYLLGYSLVTLII